MAILAAGDRTRVPELIPVRYERMLVSPFTFLRGAAAGISVQACGDCHRMNFGAFATPEENILFDINDFDETLPEVDFTVDVKRLVASVAVGIWISSPLGYPCASPGFLSFTTVAVRTNIRSILGAMMKSFSCSPLIFLVCRETVTLPQPKLIFG